MIEDFEEAIKKAYDGRNRTALWLTSALMIEAAELSELEMKRVGYAKEFEKDTVTSEAGDVLNFLTAILHHYGLTLEDAMKNNVNKLHKRGWI